MYKMERDLIVEGRVLSVNTRDRYGNAIWRILRRLIKKYDEPLHNLMDRYDIPEEIILNFKKGSGRFEGTYFEQGQKVLENLIVIDLYIDQFIKSRSKKEEKEMEKDLFDTFVHELTHNKYKSERTTLKKTAEFMKKVWKD